MPFTLRRPAIPLLLGALLAVHYPQQSAAAYAVSEFVDVATGNVEQQLFLDGFQWGAVITTPEQAVALRFHPSADPNGWGTTWYPSPFLAGGSPRATHIASIAVDGEQGIALTLAGAVADGLSDDYGSFTVTMVMQFDAVRREVAAVGTLAIDLHGGLAARERDLNLGRLASNFLRGVPVQGGAPGTLANTGDMRLVEVQRDGGTLNEEWNPALSAAHVPGDRSRGLALDVIGAVNRVDTAALGAGFQIAVAEKPSFLLELAAPAPLLSAGFFYDTSESRNFAADNIGVVPLILFPGQSFTHLSLAIEAHARTLATAPVPVPSALLSLLSAMLALAAIGRRTTRCTVTAR